MDDAGPNHPPESLGEPGEPALPAALRADLNRLHAPQSASSVPDAIDQRVLAMARWHFSRRAQVGVRRPVTPFSVRAHTRRTPLPLLRLVTLTAAAAALLFVVLILPRTLSPTRPGDTAPGRTAIAPGAVREDIDGNGHIDILDAFSLARSIRGRALAAESAPPRPEWDINGDGRVDDDDVSAIAAAAVRLDTAGGAG